MSRSSETTRLRCPTASISTPGRRRSSCAPRRRFGSRIAVLAAGDREADAKSILPVLALGATGGSELRARADGDDAPTPSRRSPTARRTRLGEAPGDRSTSRATAAASRPSAPGGRAAHLRELQRAHQRRVGTRAARDAQLVDAEADEQRQDARVDAASPQTSTGIPRPCARRDDARDQRRARAGGTARRRPARSGRRRSVAAVRSLVPIERKSAAAARSGRRRPPRAVSIIAPSAGSGAGDRRDGGLQQLAHGVELAGAFTIGSRMRSRVARRRDDRAQLRVERLGRLRAARPMPRAARRARNGGVLSAPKSSVRTVATRSASRRAPAPARARCSSSVGQASASRNAELGAQQPDALGAGRERGVDLGARWRRWRARARGDRRGSRRSRSRDGDGSLAAGVTRAGSRRARRDAIRAGLEHHDARVGVDDQHLAVRDREQRPPGRRPPSGLPERARDDGGMRGRRRRRRARSPRRSRAELRDLGRARGRRRPGRRAGGRRAVVGVGRRVPRQPRGAAAPTARTSAARAASVGVGASAALVVERARSRGVGERRARRRGGASLDTARLDGVVERRVARPSARRVSTISASSRARIARARRAASSSPRPLPRARRRARRPPAGARARRARPRAGAAAPRRSTRAAPTPARRGRRARAGAARP